MAATQVMLCYLCNMAVGQSGRVVLEIDPVLKRALHSRLVSEGRSLKDWFLEQAGTYLSRQQLPLPISGLDPSAGSAVAGKTRR